jgi:hypothetical protein
MEEENMNTEEVAGKVVELCRKQAWKEALDTLYDKNIVSVEARSMGGESPEKRGLDQVREKTDSPAICFISGRRALARKRVGALLITFRPGKPKIIGACKGFRS